MGKSIVDIQNMGDALRNTGYKNIESAVAEIVDNSVEANAKDVFVIMSEDINPVSGRKLVNEIGFLDNGDGMNTDILGSCLGIGSTTRKARKGMGRFGVGLPQASLHACPEVVVYSWQNGIDNCQMVYLNINKVKDGEQTEIADPEECSLPEKYKKYINYKIPEKEYDFSNSGTLVIWKQCDNLSPKSRGPLQKRFEFELGKKFRYFIFEGKSSIKIICEENPETAVDVFPNDPLMLMDKNYVLGDSSDPKKALYKDESGNSEPVFELYTGGGTGTGEIEVPVKYLDKDEKVCQSKVKIRFSKVKDKFYDETAFPTGNPGSYEIGKHVKKLEGISVIRAGREIDFGIFDYYNPTNEPQHRWWGCEIIFEPELDELFGVTNNKQHVRLTNMSGDRGEDIDFDEEVQPVWEQLQSFVAPTIKAMYNENEATRHNTRSEETPVTPSTNIINAVETEEQEDDEDYVNPMDDLSPEEVLAIGKEELKDQGIENPTEEQIKSFLSNFAQFEYVDRGERSPAFDYKQVLDTTRIMINTGHKFYTSFLSKIYMNSDAKTTFELFIGSLVKSVVKTDAYQKSENDRLISMFYTKLNQYIDKQLNPVNVK